MESQNKKDEKSKTKGETVLLRYPMPKYSFQGRKLEKTDTEKKEEGRGKNQQKNHIENQQRSQNENQQKSHIENQKTPNQKVNYSNSTLRSVEEGSLITNSHSNQYSVNIKKSSPSVVPKLNEIHPSPSLSTTSGSKPVSLSKPINIVTPATSKSTGSLPLNNEVCIAPSLSYQQPTKKDKEMRLEKEVASLKSQLEAQLQVNSELKRLLLASMGEDLKEDVEKLARDKAQLSLELGDHVRKMTEDYEHLDKISIQADMWRSKFLASRVMIDELANAKAFYSLQYQESQDVLQQLLNERHEIRTNLLEGYKYLLQVKNAFDPFNTHQSTVLQSTNILDLSKQTQQLSDVIRYRLLPAGVTLQSMANLDTNWQDRLTPAEHRAHELISKDVSPTEFKYQLPTTLLSSSSTTSNRYHPHTRFDNLTYNCCHKCKGEITLI